MASNSFGNRISGSTMYRRRIPLRKSPVTLGLKPGRDGSHGAAHSLDRFEQLAGSQMLPGQPAGAGRDPGAGEPHGLRHRLYTTSADCHFNSYRLLKDQEASASTVASHPGPSRDPSPAAVGAPVQPRLAQCFGGGTRVDTSAARPRRSVRPEGGGCGWANRLLPCTRR